MTWNKFKKSNPCTVINVPIFNSKWKNVSNAIILSVSNVILPKTNFKDIDFDISDHHVAIYIENNIDKKDIQIENNIRSINFPVTKNFKNLHVKNDIYTFPLYFQ